MSSSRPAGSVELQLLLHLARHRELRRLADLDDASRQVVVALVGELAQQHPAVGGADQHLAIARLRGRKEFSRDRNPAGSSSGVSSTSRA